jgi:glycosyltransferase involved in cell wall biosynthesis
VVDGQTGFLVPPGDASALAAGLKKLIASPELRARMGAAARARAVQEFSSPHICAQTLLVYAALVPGDPP